MKTLFTLGRIVATPGALQALDTAEVNPLSLLEQHMRGEWGDVPAEDARENDRSVKHGYRIISSYGVGHERVWIITEASRESTCILLPSEY
jgi:hypothetical protein